MERCESRLPSHIEGTVSAIAKHHAEHRQQATALDRVIDRLSSAFASLSFLAALGAGVSAWVAANLLAPSQGWVVLDPPPFALLVGLLALISLLMSTLILISQKRADKLARRREQMTLEVSLLSDQKAAKIIELLEELRRDMPDLRNRRDPEADEMAKPADAHAVLQVIETHEELAQAETV